MEHVNDQAAVGPFYPVSDMQGAVSVRQAKPARTVAVIPHGVNGMPESEGWKWGTRIARALCYDTAGLNRAHRAFRHGLIIGGLFAAFGALGAAYGMQLRPASQCVDVGPYTTVPNG
jgi:hypothetical protein